MPNAVVLLSGGFDSATVLAIARAGGYECYCLSIDYGQRHRSELAAAARVARALGAREHRVTTLDLAGFGGSALQFRDEPAPSGNSRRLFHTVPSRPDCWELGVGIGATDDDLRARRSRG